MKLNELAKTRKGFLILTIIGILLVFFLWWIISYSVHSNLFPGPIETFKRFGELFITPKLYMALGGTLLRLIISLGISFFFALFLGLFAGLYEWLYIILNPLVIVLRTLPTAAIIYIMIVHLKPQYALFIITSLMMFPLIYEAIVSGVRKIDKDIYDALRLDCHKIHPKSLFGIIIPLSRDNLLLGIVQSLGLGMKVSLMAEVLVGTDTISGLGRLLYHGYIELDMPTVFAIAVYSIILIGLLDLIVHYLKKKFN